MFNELFEMCSKVIDNIKEGKVDYDELRTKILIMLNDPQVSDEKIFRVLGKRYPVQTIKLVLDAMRETPKKVGPLEKKDG